MGKSAGRVLGGIFSIAWAVYDAEFSESPKRRRRIFLVADLAGHSAAEILFEREGLPGYIAAKRRRGKTLPPQLESAVRMQAGLRRAGTRGAGEPMRPTDGMSASPCTVRQRPSRHIRAYASR